MICNKSFLKFKLSISLVGWGGVGKTFLVNNWLLQMQADNYRGAQRIYGWSFFNQGTDEIISELKKLDISTMTPLDALNFLNRLKSRII